MRADYYVLLTKNNISDILSEIPLLSYTSKEKILNALLQSYGPQIINMALNEYKLSYIDLNRADMFKLKNTLIYFCKQFKKNE